MDVVYGSNSGSDSEGMDMYVSESDTKKVDMSDSSSDESMSPSVSSSRKHHLDSDSHTEENVQMTKQNGFNRRATRRPGKLKDFVDMSLDILIEIFGYLDPVDLLQLCRTTKMIRAFLLDRSKSISIWKRCLSSLEGLPQCPSDMSEPKYFHLIFEEICHFCSRSKGSHVLWGARLRVCTKCANNPRRFIDKSLFPEDIKKNFFITKILLKHLPHITAKDKRNKRFYPRKLLSSLALELGYAKRDTMMWQLKLGLCEKKKSDIEAMEQLGKACEAWYKQWDANRGEIDIERVKARKTIILERLKSNPKWADILIKKGEKNFYDFIWRHEAVAYTAKNELTTRTLAQLDGKIEASMIAEREWYTKRDRVHLLKKWLPVLKEVVAEQLHSLPPNSLCPTVSEIVRDPVFQDVLNNPSPSCDESTIDRDMFKDLYPLFTDLIHRWKKRVEGQLIRLITSSMGAGYSFNPRTVLHLATTTFCCSQCDISSLRYPEILMHQCATDIKYSNRWYTQRDHFGTDEKVLCKTLSETYWNSFGVITFNRSDFQATSFAIKLLDMDPAITTSSSMDDRDPIYECLWCHKKYEGRAVLTWRSLPYHKHQSRDENGIVAICLLDAKTSVKARISLREERLRRYALKHEKNGICVRCRIKGNVVDLMRHVVKDHQVSEPSDKDVAIAITYNEKLHTSYIWPPRYSDLPFEEHQEALQVEEHQEVLQLTRARARRRRP